MISRICATLIILVSVESLNFGRFSNRIATNKYNWELDTQAMLAKSDFKIKPDKLIERCKEVIDNGIGLNNSNDLADDFVFQFPVVGPLSKQEYIKSVGGFKLDTMFPDLNYGFHDFRVDPFQPSRVWFTAAFGATHTGDGPFGKPTFIRVEAPPQAVSLTFNEEGQVVKYTGGYVMDKSVGNTGGMGGIFGPLYAIGRPLPFPEARPWTPSIQYKVFNRVGGLVNFVNEKVRALQKRS